MERTKTIALYGLLGLAVTAAAVYFYDDFQAQRKAQAAAKAREESIQKFRDAERRRRDEVLGPLRASAPLSKWLQDGLAPLRAALATTDAALVVIPPMNVAEKAGVDLSARVLFGRQLAAALADSKAVVVDPALALLAIGEPRSLTDAELRNLLAGTRIQSVVTGTVALEQGRINLRLQRGGLKGNPQAVFEARDLPVVDTPENALAAVLPDALRALQLEARQRDRRTQESPPALQLPRSPLQAIEARGDALTGLWLQQLFGVLGFPYAMLTPRPQERVFERALSALAAFEEKSADHGVLQSRALAYLGRRQAAVKVLDASPSSEEAAALRAFLNADVPALQKAVGKLERPIARLISELELYALRYHAGDDVKSRRHADAKRLIASIPEGWQGVMTLFALSFDAWDYPSAFTVKTLLERDFALADYRAADFARSKAALGGTPVDPRVEVELTTSALLHVRRWRERHASTVCCSMAVEDLAYPTISQYLDLLDTAAEALIVGQLQFLRHVQGLPRQALARARLLDEMIFAGGHPRLLAEKYPTLYDLRRLGQLAPEALEAAAPELLDDARKVISWVPYQSPVYAAAVSQWAHFAPKAAAAKGYRQVAGEPYLSFSRPLHEEPIAGDIPLRARFGLAMGSTLDRRDTAAAVLRTACEASVYDFDPCRAYVAHLQKDQRRPGPDVDEAINSVIGQRFSGFGDRTALVARYLKDAERLPEAKNLLREALKDQPRLQLYGMLTTILRDEGEFDEAVKVSLAYPELKQPGPNTVTLSNYLQPAAAQLMRRGASQARSMVEAAAAFHDGSEGNLLARAEAALFRFDGPAALKILQAAYQRYPDHETAARIASLYFLLGQSDSGWNALAGPHHSYRAVSVALRADGADAAAALDRMKGLKMQHPLSALAGFQALVPDRSVESIDSYFDLEVGARSLSGVSVNVGNLRDTQPPKGWYWAHALKATLFAYQHLVGGRHEAALRHYVELAQIEQTNRRTYGVSGDHSWSLAYRAYALAKASQLQELAKLLEDSRDGGDTFDILMMTAVSAAASGDHAAGLRALRLAQARMPGPEDTGFAKRLMPSEYAFVEIAEWLAQDSGHRPYLDLALNYARAYQLHEPWTSWAYAFEARHTSDPERRLRATALTLRLDPKSRRLQSVPPGTQQRAKQWLNKNKPFEKAPPSRELKA